MQAVKYNTVEQYIATFPPKTRKLLKELRSLIKEAAPEAEEQISYNMPAYKLNGVLVYFAGYEKHIGFYPTNKGIDYFKEELGGFKTSKGTVQLPVDKPLPKTLIRKIVKLRRRQNLEKSAAAKK